MPYRAGSSGCPVCGDALHEVRTEQDGFERCARCNGVWLEWSTYVAMWSRLARGGELPAFAGRPDDRGPERSCPACGNRMARVQLRVVPLDHCGAHGVWF